MINKKTNKIDSALTLLKKYWGYEKFRGKQLEAIDHICSGQDAVVLFPTGAGKSLCFQIPALIHPYLTLIITPLIALMEDQVTQLKSKNIPAEAIHSGKSKREVDRILDNCAYGSTKLLYLSPEKFNSEAFVGRIREIEISMVAIDEAHCISQWGFDFRPSYLQIAENAAHFPNAVMVALTATATPKVVEDIKTYAGLRRPKIFTTSFRRDNIALGVIKTENKYELLKNSALENSGQTQIVYVRSRNATRNIAEYLKGAGIQADYYHAGLANERRQQILREFQDGSTKVVCATNAFGMGLDKADVRRVIHFDIPPSLEEYVQEYGRAGRDGNEAKATMIINRNDVNFLVKMNLEKHIPEELITDIYVGVHKYYQVPTSSGEGRSFSFSIKEISEYLNVSTKELYYGLKVLEKNDFIKIYDQRRSQNKLTVRTDIRTIRNNDLPALYQNVLLALVRMYEGILHGYCDINPVLITKQCDLSNTGELADILNELRKLGLIDFTQINPGERLVLLQDRIPRQSFGIDSRAYSQELQNSEVKMRAMLGYIHSDLCRANYVLAYFGQEENYQCGICDICKGQNDKNLDDSFPWTQDFLEEYTGNPE